MSVQNLHSLLSSRWFLDRQYGNSLLPSLFSILKGNQVTIDKKNRKPESFIYSQGTISPGAAKSTDFNQSNNDYVAIVSLKDPIYKYDQECGPRGTKSKMSTLSYYANDPSCIGVVLDIDSGGGQVAGTPEFHDYLLEYPKPVVAYTDGLMCSAAYYIGSASNHIVANKRADAIGSIGVMVHFIDFTGFYEKEGCNVITEYADQSPDKNKAFEELLKGNPELYIKKELNPLAEQFINDIKNVREGIPEDTFKGGTWNAEDSLKRNLINEIGTLQTAIDKVIELAEEESTNPNNKKSKKETMSKKTKAFPLIQGILGMGEDEQGIATIKTLTGTSGVQLNEANLEQIESAIETRDTAVTEAEASVTALESAVDAAIAVAGLADEVDADATTEAKITLLGAKTKEYGAKAAGKTAKPKSEGDTVDTDGDDAADKSTSIIDSLKS